MTQPRRPLHAAFLTYPPFGPTQLDSAFESRWPRIHGPLRHALDGWFAGGGGTCHLVPFEGELEELANLEIDVVCFPELVHLAQDQENWNRAHAMMFAACERAGDRMAIVDPPPDLTPQEVKDWRINSSGADTAYGALYYPWVRVAAPNGDLVTVPSCGHVAAAWARAAHSPGNLVLEGVLDVATDLTGPELDILTPVGINALRAISGWGIRTCGVRTLSSEPALRRIATTRLLNVLRRATFRGDEADTERQVRELTGLAGDDLTVTHAGRQISFQISAPPGVVPDALNTSGSRSVPSKVTVRLSPRITGAEALMITADLGSGEWVVQPAEV
ncbi:MAG TPA: hypothetical protein VGR06_16020 [Actinophytocola sp.]|uniref:hypothetical protein n=1 Tax=Actinophytocola sp. TaxID=1872138 RepID=UPI002E0CEE5A|nr:hypothetical protein [Actinophytocola sp.]